MDTKYEEKPPNYSSVVFEGQSLSPSAPPTDSGPVRIDMPVVPTFFEQAMLSVPSAINITHGESLYANDTDYFIRDANGSLLFSGQVESVDGEKIIPFKNWERRTVFVVKITTPTDLMVVDIYTQNGTTHVGTMTNDFKSEDWPTLTTISTGSSHKTYHPVVVSEEDFGLKDLFGKMAANVHITRNYSPRAQRSGAAEVIIVAVLSILYCLPVWWHITYEYGYIDGTYTHNTIVYGTLGKKEDFQLYYVFWGNIFVVALGPFLTLAILNTAILIKVRQSNQMRKNLTQSESNDVSLTKMLLTIIAIYLACYAIGLYQRMSQVIGGVKASPHKLVKIGLFLVNVNSSINFIIYCLMGKKFRKTFIGLFEWRKGRADIANPNPEKK